MPQGPYQDSELNEAYRRAGEQAKLVRIPGEEDDLQKQPRITRVMVTCSPSSGSRQLSASLRAAKLDCPHQQMGRRGIVSPYLAFDSTPEECGQRVHGHPIAKQGFDWIVQLVRHPLDVIQTLTHGGVGPSWWPYQQFFTGVKYPGQNPIWSAAEFWFLWNQGIEWQGPNLRIRIEHLETEWALLMTLLEHKAPYPDIMRVPPPANRDRLEWGQLGPYEADVRPLAERYGYT